MSDNHRAMFQAFVVALLVFAGLDMIWLTLVAGPMFQSRVGPILRPEPMLAAAIAFYPIYVFGLVGLAVKPALAARSVVAGAAYGALLGLTAYATFDLTNLAIIQGWTMELAAVDIGWGIVATAAASIAGTLAGLRVQPVAPNAGTDRQ